MCRFKLNVLTTVIFLLFFFLFFFRVAMLEVCGFHPTVTQHSNTVTQMFFFPSQLLFSTLLMWRIWHVLCAHCRYCQSVRWWWWWRWRFALGVCLVSLGDEASCAEKEVFYRQVWLLTPPPPFASVSVSVNTSRTWCLWGLGHGGTCRATTGLCLLTCSHG